ncbi:unnamed protein product [Menidia menidia]|uniref:Cyclin-Q n=1 Tax=Menidia menidia TaxID=238744 RepID=A0A8S4BM53_9TELE|nr:unnamed protein product [Menidia menidia]
MCVRDQALLYYRLLLCGVEEARGALQGPMADPSLGVLIGRPAEPVNQWAHSFNTLEPLRGSAPLECDRDFWELRDSVVQCELVVLRQLNFHVSFEHPHKYLLHYLLSVKSLVNRHAWCRTPVAETSWALLRDCYHGAVCIRHSPQHIAVATLYLALNSYGVELPAGEREWWQDVTKADIEAVISDLLRLYDLEAKCI